MTRFVQSVVVNAPVAEVFAFHERDDALELVSPGFPPARIVSRTGGIRPGARVVLRIGPVKWVALHGEFIPNLLFTDEQESGPFARWSHRHEFEDLGDRTRLTDRIEYELPGGAAVTSCLGWAFNIGLRRMFDHRHRVTREFCERNQ